jgi:hypothetical protein
MNAPSPSISVRRLACPRRLGLLGLLTLIALALPATAGASPRQFSILQDDGVLLGNSPHDVDEAMAEAKALGFDSVRTFVSWSGVSPANQSRTMPAGFDPGDPDSPGYDWARYDRFIDAARANGLEVLLTLSPPQPYWASDEPRRCPHFIGGYRSLGKSCYWKPNTRLFAQFAKAVALRYGSRARGPHGGAVKRYSIWNEPNLEHYLYPQLRRTRFGTVDVAAKRYRSLWFRAHRAIARYDRPARGRVLFGETAAISSPLDTLYAALCLDPEGRPFRGRLRRLQGCARPRKLPIGGLAVHPYNKDANGTVFQRSHTTDSLAMAHLNRAHQVLNRAARARRIPRRRGIYITEFGFQTNPPDEEFGVSLDAQARSLNQSERLFYRDRRVKAVAQFELYDAPEVEGQDVYNTGLRLVDGAFKPAWEAFRMPLVVTKLGRDRVEVWGMVRPAPGKARVVISAAPRRRGAPAETVRSTVTGRNGYFRIRLERHRAAGLRYRAQWTAPGGDVFSSRLATAGRKIRYKPLR